jgi:anti-sigma factor RsiW
MSTPLFKEPKGSPECPSELRLDRWEQGELAGADKAELDAHVPGCAHCQARVQERALLMQMISEPERRKMLDQIMKAAPPATTAAPWWRRWLGESRMMPAYAAAFALVLVFLSIRLISLPEGPIEGVQSKGGLALTVYREHAGSVERARLGEEMDPGDRLRFGIEVPIGGHVMIVGIEADGASYVCFPSNGASRSAPVNAGRTDALPGAIELDESTGREELHLIHCPRPFTLEEVTPVDVGRLAERRCVFTSFELSKRRR